MTVLDTAVYGICPRPEKQGRFRTLEYAEAAARTRSLMAGRPIYTYACDCGLYHLTRSKPGKNKRRQPERFAMNSMNATAALAPESDSVLVWSSDPAAETIEELLERARYGSSRAQSLADDIDRLVIDLTAVLDQDAARIEKESRAAELRAEIALRTTELERLEAELNAAEEAPAQNLEAGADVLDDADEATYTAPLEDITTEEVADETTSALSRGQVDALVPGLMYDGRVRGWARSNGYTCGKNGRINTQLVRMWIAAHPDEAQA